MVVQCSFGSAVANFIFLGKTIESNVENSVHFVKAIILLHNIIRELQDIIEPNVQMFTAVETDPRAYIPSSKRNNASS
jgi:hypothetical protein